MKPKCLAVDRIGAGRHNNIWLQIWDSGMISVSSFVETRNLKYMYSIGPVMRDFGLREDQMLDVQDSVIALFDDDTSAVQLRQDLCSYAVH